MNPKRSTTKTLAPPDDPGGLFASVLLAAWALMAIVAVIMLSGPVQAAEEKKAGEPKPALTVATIRPQMTDLTLRLAANGSIAAWQEASVGSEVQGLRLKAVLVNVGDVVKAGQLLASFASETIEADVAQAAAAVAEAQAQAADAAANAARARSLEGTGALSSQQIAQLITLESTARARVQAVQAAHAAQKLRLKHTEVRAPDAGVISARQATVGAVAGPGTELFRLIRKGRIEWRAEVTSAELARLTPGTTATVLTAGGTSLVGKVRMVAPTVDPVSRNGLVYVDLPPLVSPGKPAAAGAKTTKPRGKGGAAGEPYTLASPAAVAALPGMFARGEFALGGNQALTVPQSAVVVRDGFSYVFVVGAGNRVTQVKVSPGRRQGDRLEVTSGLAADAQVVASGAGFLNDGDLVRVSGAAPAAGAASR